MALSPLNRAHRTRVSFSDNLVKLVLTIFLVPAPFEIITAFAKKESYDFRRLAVVLGGLIILATSLMLVRHRRVFVQSIVGYYLILAGLGIAAFGVAITFKADFVLKSATWSPAVETTLSALTPSFGLLLVASGTYLIRDQLRRTKEEMETPGPANITNPRTIRVNNNNASLWKSEVFNNRPAAEGIVDLCKNYLSTIDLHFVAYYTHDGDCLFYVDFLDDDGMAHYDVHDTPERRRQYEQIGRHMRYLATRLDRRFRGLESGLLVRMVLDVEKGALFFYNLKREGFLVGVTLDQTEVDPTDRKLSTLANEILVYRGGRPDDDFYRK